jgi:proteasome lid subunit RPN8/RPN11
LIVNVDGVERYYACRNLSTSKNDQFKLSPEDYVEAEDAGTVIAVVHSHPDAAPRPSQGDLVACEASGLPWYIFSVHRADSGQIEYFGEHAFEPTGYEAPLVGRKFVHGILDCYALIRDWYEREMGITLKEYNRSDDWWQRGENLYISQYEDAGFEVANEPLEIGDVIIMQIRAPEPNHAGVYIGEGLFLHHLYGRLSSRDVYGGYWKEKTRLIVRRRKHDPKDQDNSAIR